MTNDESRLIERFQRAEPGAFDAVYRACGDRVYRFCLHLTGRAADAEELAQEVFLDCFRGATRFEGRASLTTWLYKIAVRRWSRMSAAAGRNTVQLDDVERERSAPAQAGASTATIEAAIAALPVGLRLAFVLVKLDGFTYREAAEALGAPQGTIQYRVHEARVRLQAALAEAGDEVARPVCPAGEE